MYKETSLLDRGPEVLINALKVLRSKDTFENKFSAFVDIMAPPVPDVFGLPELRHKINNILAPTLLNKYLPPIPRGLAKDLKRR